MRPQAGTVTPANPGTVMMGWTVAEAGKVSEREKFYIESHYHDFVSGDLNKAKQLITASGVATPVTVSMDIQAGNPIDQQIATIVQGVWKTLGVNVNIQTLSASDYINAQFDSSVGPQWKPVIAYVERIAGCKITKPMPEPPPA